VAVENVTRDQFIKFLTDQGVKLPCEVCGSSEGWILPDGETMKIGGIFNPRPDGGYVMPSTITPTIMLVCKHCTNIRFFAEIVMAGLIKGVADAK